MNCKLYQCEGVADFPYPCCSESHGSLFKQKRNALLTYQNEGKEGFTGYGLTLFNEMSVGELNYYSKI